MRLGIWTPLPHTIKSEPTMVEGIRQVGTRGGDGTPDKSFQFALDVVSRGEALGFDLTLIAERLMGPDLEAWMLTTALAARTKTIQIMPAVYPGMMTPQLVAKMGATLDRITGGRFVINVVNGWFQKEFELFSNGGWIESSDARYRRMEEFVRVLKGLWSEDHFTFKGEFYQADDATLPLKPVRIPHPPIYTASRADSGKDVIAQHCDLWFVSFEPDYRRYEENFRAHQAGHRRPRRARAPLRPQARLRHERACHLRGDAGRSGCARRGPRSLRQARPHLLDGGARARARFCRTAGVDRRAHAPL